MKKILIFILALVIVYFGAVFFIKSGAKDVFNNEVAAINKNPGVTATLTEENNGFFSSSAVISITADGQTEEAVKLVQSQHYGPILFTDEGMKFGAYFLNTDIHFPEAVKSELPEGVDGDDLFDIGFFSGFSGVIEGDAYFKGVEITQADGTLSSISPMELHIDTDVAFNEIIGEGSWPGMTVKQGEEGLSVNNVKVKFNQKKVSGNIMDGTGIYTGDAVYTLEQVMFSQGGQFFRLDNFAVNAIANMANENAMNVELGMTTDLLNMNGEKYSDNSIKMVLGNLDVNIMQELGELGQKMQQATLQGQDLSAYQMQMMNLMMRFVQSGPSIQLKDTHVGTEDGQIKADLNVNVDKSKVDANNPMSLMMAVDAVFDATGPEAYFTKKGMGAMIDQWAQMNFVVKDSGTLKVNATFQNGMPMLNGQPMQGIPGM